MWIPYVPKVSKFELMLSEALFQYLRHAQIEVNQLSSRPSDSQIVERVEFYALQGK